MMELIQIIENDVCRNCENCSPGKVLCYGEMLPIERAIKRNLEGLGLCEKVKRYINKIWESDEE